MVEMRESVLFEASEADCRNDQRPTSPSTPEGLEAQALEMEHAVVDSGSPYSTRIARMSRQRSMNTGLSEMEIDLVFSKEHWADLQPAPEALTKEILMS